SGAERGQEPALRVRFPADILGGGSMMLRSEASRRRFDRLLFLGPATLMLAIFFIAPVIIDVGISFTDMGRNLQVTKFTTENFQRMLSGDRRLLSVLSTTLIY